MMYLFLASLWYFLPAGLANVTPIIVSKIPVLSEYSYPLDFYLKIKGNRVLGSHKTVRGILSGICVAILVSYLQLFLYNSSAFFREISIIHYPEINPLFIGFLLGLGALGGDSMKSFFKRRFLIDSGKSWFFFDQSDYIVGALVLSSLYIRIEFIYLVSIFIVWFILHICASLLGYSVKLKNDPL